MPDNGYYYFLCFLKPVASANQLAMFMSDKQDRVSDWKANRSHKSAATHPNKTSKSKDLKVGDVQLSTTDTLARLMNRFERSTSGYRILTDAGMRMLSEMEAVHFSQEFFMQAGERLDLVEDDGEYLTFGVSLSDISFVNKHTDRLSELREAQSVLPGAILLSLVATFDSVMVDVMTVMLRSRPDRFRSSSKVFSISELLDMGSIGDVIAKAAADEVSGVMRKSHEEQIVYIEKSFDIKFPRDHAYWSTFLEIFERRNLVAHGDLIVNDIYIRKCKDFGHSTGSLRQGDVLPLTKKYMLRSSDILIEFGIEIICLVWKKNFPDKLEEAYKTLSALSYKLILYQRYALASRLLEFALGGTKSGVPDRMIKRMTVNLANCYLKQNDEEKCKATLGRVDFSASSDDFQICLAALDRDVDRFVSLMSKVTGDEAVGVWGFRSWPVFDWVRSDPRVEAEFLRIFGEPMIKRSSSNTPVDDEKSAGGILIDQPSSA